MLQNSKLDIKWIDVSGANAFWVACNKGYVEIAATLA